MQSPITRRRFLHAAAAGALSAAFVMSCAKKSAPPNILFIAIDDLNDWTGCLGGHPNAKTPYLDKLASQGVLFTNAYCAAPACNPSRAALMTGVRPSTSGVYHNPQPWRESEVLKDAVTLPQYFRAHGYRAMGSGKIFHGKYIDAQSWDYYYPQEKHDRPPDPQPEGKPLNGIPNAAHFDWGIVDAQPEEMSDWQVSDWVINQLEQKHDKPFFLACGIFRPHLPWYVPQKYFDMHPLDDIELPHVKDDDLDDIPEAGKKMVRLKDHKNVLEHEQWKKAVQAYLASTSFADECVGRVVAALENSEYAENTIIVLWSDHGWHLGEKLHWRKFALWEEATHNVMMFKAPGVTLPGGRCNAPVNLLDIYPTLLRLAGLPDKSENEGYDLTPLLKDPSAAWDKPSLTTHGKNNHTIRSKRWRYIHYEDGSEELYDHENDENEWTNLAGDPAFAAVIAEHKKWLPKVNADDSPYEK